MQGYLFKNIITYKNCVFMIILRKKLTVLQTNNTRIIKSSLKEQSLLAWSVSVIACFKYKIILKKNTSILKHLFSLKKK